MAKRYLAALVVAAALGSMVGAKLQSSQDLFQKALSLERAGGDLKGAIALYKQIVDKNEDEALAAQAQLRIGFCLEKSGLDEARKAFQAVIDRFPKQAGAVKIAREKIAGLLNPPPAASDGGDLRLRRIWTGKDRWPYGSLSPDGREFLRVDWAKGEVLGQDTASGKIRVLAASPQLKYDQAESLYMPAIWSHEGKKFAFFTDTQDASDLGVFDISTSVLRFIFKIKNKRPSSSVCAWTPDGTAMLVNMKSDNQPRQWAMVNLADGRLNLIKAQDERITMIHHISFSPDGRYVAFDHGNPLDRYDCDISILALEKKLEQRAVVHSAFDYLLGWAPDGRSLVFASNRSGLFDVWSCPWDGEKISSEPRLIKADIGLIEPLALTEEGRLFYSLRVRPEAIVSRETSFEESLFLTPGRRVDDRFEGSNSVPEISPDGRYVAFLSIRRPRPRVNVSPLIATTPDTICIFSYEGKPTREFTPDLHFVERVRLQWSADSRFVYFWAEDPSFKSMVYRLDIETGDMRMIAEKAAAYIRVISPDGKRGYGGTRAGNIISIFVVDFATGVERRLGEIKGTLTNISISPDGRFLALTEEQKAEGRKIWDIVLIAVDGGEETSPKRLRLEADQTGRNIFRLAWAKDSRSLLCPIPRDAGDEIDHTELWNVPIDGGAGRKIEFPRGELVDWFSFHPASRRLVYASSPGESFEIWALENFLPKK